MYKKLTIRTIVVPLSKVKKYHPGSAAIIISNGRSNLGTIVIGRIGQNEPSIVQNELILGQNEPSLRKHNSSQGRGCHSQVVFKKSAKIADIMNADFKCDGLNWLNCLF